VLRSAEVRPAPARTGAPAALRLLFVALILYATFGKGFAYAGWPPVFVGEVLLMVVLVAAWHRQAVVPRNPAAAVTAALIGLALIQVAIDVLSGDHALLEIARGVAPLTYAGFAIALYALMRQWEERAGRAAVLAAVDAATARVVPVMVAALAALAIFLVVGASWAPTWPGSGVPLLLTKPGDIGVSLVLVAPFVLRREPDGMPVTRRRVWIVLWAAAAVLVSFRSRGALFALLFGLASARPRPVRTLRMLAAVGLLLFVLYATGLSVRAGNREVSFEGAKQVAASIVDPGAGDAPGSNLVATRRFRTVWWGDIWDDAVHRPMLLAGNGWGDNLTQRYHGQDQSVGDPRALRSPHSIFYSLLGRAGLVTAVGFLFVPAATVARSLVRSGDAARSRIVEGTRGAVVASVVTALADVYLESPQGAILLWSMLGFLWWATAPPVGPSVDSEPAP
jgi:hypothetical protein